MEENKNIKLALGDVSLSPILGIYYIDMRPSIVHYTDNIYGGKFDENGVPMINTTSGLVYSPINIAQYGFILHANYHETLNETYLQCLKNCLDKLEEIKTENMDTCVWYHHFDNEKYTLPIPWSSAMAQGEIISFFLRMYQILNDKSFLETAIKAYHFMKIRVEDGGVRRFDESGNLWLEEYPTEKPIFVLNGFIYAIFGMYDLYRVTHSNEVKTDIDNCIKTLKNNIHKFDAGFWSYYDLQKKELVRYYYQKNVHVPQLEILYLLTGEGIFLKYKNKWERKLKPLNYLFVQLLYRLKYRLPFVYNHIISIWKN